MATKRSKAEILAAGQSLFASRVVWKLADCDKGKMVVIDIDSGDYEVDVVESKALDRLLSRRPDACTWTVQFEGRPVIRGSWRMTYPNGYTIKGGKPSREEIREALAEARRQNDD